MAQSLPWQLVDLIEEDLKSIGRLATECQTDQGLRRSYIRVFFSGVESILTAFSDEILSEAAHGFVVSNKDIAGLKDRKYSNDSDKILDQVVFLGAKEKLKLVVRLLAELRCVDYNFPNTVGWNKYQSAICTRNRLAHPRTPEDYSVSVGDFEVVMLGKNWFKNELFGQFVSNYSP